MGAGSSKAARRLPTAKQKPSWAGARTPQAAAGEAQSARREDKLLASETKSEEITKDSIDPQFMANLSRLGAVRVDHHMQTVRTAENINRGFRSREQSEAQANSPEPTRNHLLASTLSDLLDEQKDIASRQDLERLAAQYGMDVAKLDRISRFVNSPSIDEDTRTTTVNSEDGVEQTSMTTIWIQPTTADDPLAKLGRPR